MSHPVVLPLWVFVVLALLAAWAIVSRLLLPSVRWFIGRRVNRLTEQVNRTLDLKIPPIAMTRRQVLIDRLVYDPKVLNEVMRVAEAEGIPREVALKRVEHYAREIVPAFNAYAYFRVGNGIAKAILNMMYRVRIGHADDAVLRGLNPEASVVFVMNHRSNVDYILVAHLARKRVALSYAVGEWAKVWPIQQLVRSLGAYFVRRGSGNDLYRRVLERYVQIAVEGGAVQAIFPEGGLSRDGLLRQPKIGLLDYMLRAFDVRASRDIVFVPVAMNYDRVLEDRTLLRDTDPASEPRSGLAALRTTLAFAASQLWLRLRGRWYRYGYACANFGAPISLRRYLAYNNWDPATLDRDARAARVTELAGDLMTAVGRIVPVLPVSLVARLFADEPEREWTEGEIRTAALALQKEYESLGAHVYVPRQDPDYSVMVGLRMLMLRKLVTSANGRFRLNPAELPVVRYYANAIAHLTRPPLWLTPSAERR
ncbi:MAG TPA: 1-acyl-sn-glycerol-3-phosphate acyltransferase [Steroidobacteraceae bacterium]|nr:1-acyl-sn-glycerol-3-phosphate acyltransferase [Steroidobacteraceae bacterium]